MLVINCNQCGNEFSKTNARQKYCSFSCSQKYKNLKKRESITVNCKVCNNDFSFSKSSLKYMKDKDICVPCKRKAVDQERPSIRQCLHCGSEFRGLPSTVKLCSDACIKASRLNPYLDFKKNKKSIDKPISRNIPCSDCAFGKSSNHSEIGWECLANARVCSPFTLRSLFKDKKELV